MSTKIRPARIEARAYRAPIEKPVRTSFGTMIDRPCVLARVIDHDGDEGWGEAWCNFPIPAAEHRARLIEEVVAPLFLDREFDSPRDAFHRGERGLAVLAIQTGEPGPLSQALSAIDMALWDLTARRAGLPLYRALGADDARPSVPAYASGINPDRPDETAARQWRAGHRAFKLKIGFDERLDLANLRAMRHALGPNAVIAVDANQAFDPPQALAMARVMADQSVSWLEEPLRADTPWHEWIWLARRAPIPLAGGENLRGEQWNAAMAAGVFKVLQPDIGKWGGVSGNLDYMARAVAAARWFCPHWLGGGFGLMASAHFLAALGGPGMLEMDINTNPLRDLLLGDCLKVRDGQAILPREPGIGPVPDLATLEPFRTWPPR